MSHALPRLRMFAGPNGSGKSVLKSYLPEPLLGAYINPDDIEAGVKRRGFASMTEFGVSTTADEILPVFANSRFLAGRGLADALADMEFQDGKLIFPPGSMNSYFASVLSDFLRTKLVEAGRTFTFETVMSHPGKVELLRKSQQAGYRTYLYYVATDDPAINVSRVANRVALGGHAVPEDKIVSRYHKSLALLMDAVRAANRSYIFDNSTDHRDGKHTWLAEVTDGRKLELKSDSIPSWFKRAVLDKIA